MLQEAAMQLYACTREMRRDVDGGSTRTGLPRKRGTALAGARLAPSRPSAVFAVSHHCCNMLCIAAPIETVQASDVLQVTVRSFLLALFSTTIPNFVVTFQHVHMFPRTYDMNIHVFHFIS